MRIFQNTVGQYSPFQYWSYTGTGSQTSFALSPSVNTLASSYLVQVNGLVQRPIAQYTISNTVPVNIVFGNPPTNGASITVVNLGYQPPGVIQDVTQSDATPTNSSQTQTVGAWLAYLLAQLATKLTAPTAPPSGFWTLGSSNGIVGWQQFTSLPPVPSAPGQVVLSSAGSNQPPTWQSLPALSIGPIVSTGSDWTNNTGAPVSVGGVSYPNGATISTPRFVADRFAETVKVADFGAVGDGVIDDTDAIQAAINYAVSLGNAVVEFQQDKTYNLNHVSNNTVPRTMNTANGYVSKHHLQIVGGTTSLKLLFRGNNAKLYTNLSPTFSSGTLGQMIYTATEFDTIVFQDLTFERGPARITDAPGWTFQELAFGAFPPTTSPSNRLQFDNITWVNVTQFINGIWFNGGDTTQKLKLCAFNNCIWLYPYASNRTHTADGGSYGVCSYFDQWTDVLQFNNCYIDMASQGFVPNDCGYLRDGFNVGNGVTTYWNGCTIKNSYIEAAFSFAGQPDIQILTNTITWPDVGQTVSVTVGNAPRNTGVTFTPGQRLLLTRLFPSFDRGAWVGGLFEFVSSSAYPYVNGTSITLRRLSSQLIPEAEFYTNQPPAAGATVNLGDPNGQWTLMNFDVNQQHSSHFNNCKFIGNNIRRQDGTTKCYVFFIEAGGTGYTSAPTVNINPANGVTATATISGGQVVGINITTPNILNNMSAGYFSTQPTITFSGGGGSGAKAKLLFYPNTPAPAIWASIHTNVTNCTFSNCGTCIFCKATTVRQGPNVISNNTFILENNWSLNPDEYAYLSIGQLWHDYLKFTNNIVMSSMTPETTSIAGRYVEISNNIFKSYTKHPGRRRRALFSPLNNLQPSNMKIADNLSVGLDYLLFLQSGGSILCDSYVGTDQIAPVFGNSIAFRKVTVDFRPTRNGWIRLNPFHGDPFINRGVAGTYTIGALKFTISTSNSDNTVNIAVLATDRRVPITKIRVVRDGSVVFPEVYVNNWTFYDIQSAVQASVESADGSGLLSNPTSYKPISSIVADGTDALVTSNGHGLLDGEAIFISESNSTPSINGTRQVTSVTPNTFKISGITITGSGTAGEFMSNKRNGAKPINITAIIQSGPNVSIAHDGFVSHGENPGLFQQVWIYGSNSVPSLNGLRSPINITGGAFDVAGITLTSAGTQGTFIMLQDYAFNATVAAEIDLTQSADIYIAKNIGLGSARLITGTGAELATTAAPDGSIFLRTDGDPSTTLYVRSGSNWNPLASY
jgi:hypothetical protein